VVEVDGLEGHLRVSSEPDRKSKSSTSHDRKRKRQGGKEGMSSSTRGEAGFHTGASTADENMESALPTATDLAESFLQAEPPEEKAELEAAISSQSQVLRASMISNDDGEDDSSLGTGAALSLPSFIANFLKGIVDRLQVKVHGIILNVDIDVSNDSPQPGSSTDLVTLQLKINDVDIEGVTFTNSEGATINLATKDTQDGGQRNGKRRISLRQLKANLISDATLFSSMAQSLAPPSRSVTESDVLETERVLYKSRSNPRSSSFGSADVALSPIEPITASQSIQTSAAKSDLESSKHSLLTSSVVASDSGRFDDAPEDEDCLGNSQGRVAVQPADPEIDLESSVFDPSEYLDRATESQLLDHDEDEGLEEDKVTPDEETRPPFELESRRRSLLLISPLHTPRASEYQSQSPSALKDYFDSNLGSSSLSASSKSAVLSSKPLTKPTESQASSSQLLSGSVDSVVQSETRLVEAIPTNSEEVYDAGGNSSILGDDLTQSRLFTHEDAESMYMSALSQGPVPGTVPGAWDSSSSGSTQPRSAPASPIASQSLTQDGHDNLESARLNTVSKDRDSADSSHGSVQGSAFFAPVHEIITTPLVQKNTHDSARSSASSEEYTRVSKQIFNLDEINVYLPSVAEPPPPDQSQVFNKGTQSRFLSSAFSWHSNISQSVSPNIPGGFSTSDRRASVNASRPVTQPEKQKATEPKHSDQQSMVEILMGKLKVQFDFSVSRLIVKLLHILSHALCSDKPILDTPKDDVVVFPSTIHLRAERISLKFLERLSTSCLGEPDTWVKPPPSDILLRTTLKGFDISVDVSQAATTAAITLQKFVFGYAKENIVSFDAGLQMGASTRDLTRKAGIDLSIDLTKTQHGIRFDILTLPLHVSIDLQRLDETLSWFGGLSSVLNMGSSVVSNATITAANPSKHPVKPRGVRFETESHDDAENDSSTSQIEGDARLGGFFLDLVGKECSIGIDTTAVKIVSRQEAIGLSIGKIKISGPHLHKSNEEPAILAEIGSTRIEFLEAPKDVDLEKLLSLITPSKTQYDRQDDILLDTLLRQRRKGAVLRVKIDSLKTQVTKLEQLSYLPELGEEVSGLSTVAKYLPEDDRPGLLSLVLVRDVDVQVDINEDLGNFQLAAGGVEVAQITFPSLVASSLKSIAIHHNGKDSLLGAATDITLREIDSQIPAVMMRMIGDEMEPVIRVNLYNLKLEYMVPLVTVLLGISENITTEELAASIARSVATLADRKDPSILKTTRDDRRKSMEQQKSPDSRPLMIDIGIRDCILGLNPLGLPSKVLFVTTDAHISATLPKDNNTKVTAEMNKGTLLVVDDVANVALRVESARVKRQSFDGGSRQVADLLAIGFVSVGYISLAKATVRVFDSGPQGEKCVDVELQDDLLVLESCADSTQTLIAALNGLKPPMKPSQDIKYRTKVMPMEDLLASISGDAFGTAEGNYDFDEDFGPGLHGNLEDDTSELGFDSRYYQEDEFVRPNEEDGDYLKSGEGSVIFDMLQSRDTKDGVLLENFREQERVLIEEELNFEDNHFGSGSIVEGTAHRWNSAKNTYDKTNVALVRESPLKVCARDVNIIWNLFDGYDWKSTQQAISKAVQEVESKTIEKRSRARHDRRSTFDQDISDEETVIGDFLFNSIYIGVPPRGDPRDLSMAINRELNDDATETESIATTSHSASPSRQGSSKKSGGNKLRLRRSKHHKITFELKGVNLDIVTFPPGSGETESSIDIRVRDFDIFDHVPTSTWKKFATYMHDAGERESGTSQIHIELLNVKPIPQLAASEIVLKVTVLPLRLHVDQDALDFITRFFEFKDDTAPASTAKTEVPFLQRVEVNSIPVRLDFKPKRVDYVGLRSGHTTEFMNFIVLDQADMVLKHTIIYGISGFDKLGKVLNDIWMPEIKRNQLPGILAGLAPVRGVSNIAGGFRDLIVIPLREYRKDGRIVRSISKGAAAFARTTGTELVKLGAKVAVGTQTVLQGAEEILTKPHDSPPASWDDGDLEEEEQKQISLYADQPIGVVQGLKGAYASLQRDLITTRDVIIAVPAEIMESGTAQGAAKVVLRRAPTVILRPVIGASKAIGQTLMGATNSLDPQNRRRVEDVSNAFE
jgi:autophagy-related protein 2